MEKSDTGSALANAKREEKEKNGTEKKREESEIEIEREYDALCNGRLFFAAYFASLKSIRNSISSYPSYRTSI